MRFDSLDSSFFPREGPSIMFTLLRSRHRFCDAVNRRSWLHPGSLGMARLVFSRMLQASWRLIVVALAVGIPTGRVLACNRPGHMVTGAIAYAELKKTHPEVVAKVVAHFKQHPQYKTKWLPEIQLLPAEDKEIYLFMAAARWPDDVREDKAFHPDECRAWHGLHHQFRPNEASVKTKDTSKVNIETAFAQNQSKVQSDAPGKDRAVALCWVFHLVGDVHQPLHTVTLFNEEFPKGDASATHFYIRTQADPKNTVTLHSFWDNLVQGSDKVSSVKEKASEIRDEYPRKKLDELKHDKFSKWVDESFDLAKTVAYRNGKLKGSRDEQHGVLLPADYLKTVEPVAQRRIALAGYRLADLIDAWFK